MNIQPITRVNTSVLAPPSKAYTLRAFFISALAYGTSEIVDPLLAKDQLIALKLIQDMGCKVTKKGNIMIDGIEGKPKASDFFVFET